MEMCNGSDIPQELAISLIAPGKGRKQVEGDGEKRRTGEVPGRRHWVVSES
jgi:hypothetical protein